MFDQISSLIGHYEDGRLSRRDLILGLAALSVAPRVGAQTPFRLKGGEINHIAINVPDVQRSRDFYRELLDLPILDESPRSCFLGLGQGNFLSLFTGDPGLSHYCIGIEDYQVERVFDELERRGLAPRQTPGTDRIYFDDPDGIEVQLSAIGHQDLTD